MTPAILIVDSDLATRRVLRTALSGEGYRTWEAATAQDGLATFSARAPQVIILELDLPDRSGLDALAEIRDASDVPVLLMSSQVASDVHVEALDGGANDFVMKPFREAELLARLRAVLRAAARQRLRHEVIRAGPLRLEPADAKAFLRDLEVELTRTEFKLLEMLAREAGRVVTHRRLLSTVWGAEYATDIQYLRVFMRRLRCKLEASPEAPQLILTAPRVGYRLRATD
jgi:two-component system KDP operon response regulator KdpE